MEYFIEPALLWTLAHDLKSAELAAILQTGSAYKELTLLMTLALFAMVFADQLSLVMGKFTGSKVANNLNRPRVDQQPFRQLFKNQLIAGFNEESAYVSGSVNIGSLKFFVYNLLALGSWLLMLLLIGSALRALWVEYVGSVAPFEVEIIAAVLAVYLLQLIYSLIKNKSN